MNKNSETKQIEVQDDQGETFMVEEADAKFVHGNSLRNNSFVFIGLQCWITRAKFQNIFVTNAHLAIFLEDQDSF